MTSKIQRFVSAYKLPLLSGVLIGTSYIPFPPWAALFAFAPLWVFLFQEKSPKKAFIGGFITAFLLTLIGFYWVAYVSREHGQIPWIVAIPIMLLFCCVATFYIPVCSWIWCRWFNSEKTSLGWKWLGIATVFALGEKLYWTLFPWNFGYTWVWIKAPIMQTAEWWGVDGLSSITLFYSAGVGYVYYIKQQLPAKAKKWALIVVSSFVALNVLGYFLTPNTNDTKEHVHALVIQGNIGNLQKEKAQRGTGYRSEIVQKYKRLTLQALAQHKGKPIDMIIWPETATPLRLSRQYHNFNSQRQLFNFVREMKIPLVTGAYHQNPETGGMSNSLFVIMPNGQVSIPPYRKTHLLAFGEYFPIVSRFPELEDKLGLGSFERGQGPISMPVDGINIGPQICYESLFPVFSKGLADAGADVFVNLTNDSWFGPFSEPYQNMIMTLARSIEFRKPTLRSTNTGFTTAMDASGKMYERSDWFVEQSLYFKIPIRVRSTPTVFQRFPYIPEVALTVLLMLFLFRRFQMSKEAV